jgi:hypothetical protein
MGDRDRMTRCVDTLAPDPQAHPLFALAHILKHAVNGRPEVVDALMSPDLEAKLWSDFQYTHVMAQASAMLGRSQEALRWLRQSVDRGFLRHAFLSTDPLLARLHDDPDFATLMTHVRRAAGDLKASVARPLPER